MEKSKARTLPPCAPWATSGDCKSGDAALGHRSRDCTFDSTPTKHSLGFIMLKSHERRKQHTQ
eukprot:73779-Pleurochrysis_carterae.AAC.3